MFDLQDHAPHPSVADPDRGSAIGDACYPGKLPLRADGPDGIAWEASIDAALARAQREHKPLFVAFAARFDGRSNAPYC